jgi:transposase-like protein
MKGNNFYSESLKQEVVQGIKSGLISKAEAKRKYDIRGCGCINKWIRNFESTIQENRKLMDYKKSDKEALIKRIMELERQIKDEHIRSEGLSKMIDIAEEQLKVTIRKKSSTKQSR